ncbi:MAG: hypothetical protein M9916_13570 [Crocinitomicaceae bacterium]|nr:hypothetical protein [Crocinitomicaceae bacterium]
MRTNNLILIATMVIGSMQFSVAQYHENGAKHPKGDMTATIPDLTAEQKEKIQEINTSYKAKFEEIKKTESQNKEEMMNLRKLKRQEITAVLTADQIAKMKENREQFKKARIDAPKREMSPDAMAKRFVANLDQKVQLTDKQKDQVYQLTLDSQQKMKAIHSDSKLSDDAKKEQYALLKKEQKKSLNKILTKSQQTALKEANQQKKDCKGNCKGK